MYNTKMDCWNLIKGIDAYPEEHKAVFILIERFKMNSVADIPYVRRAEIIWLPPNLTHEVHAGWKLLDYNSKTESEILPKELTAVAWRYC